MSRKLLKMCGVFCTLVGVLASRGSAQTGIGFESLLSNVTDIGIFKTCWKPRGALEQQSLCAAGQSGFGVDVSYNVGQLAFPFKPAKKLSTPKAALNAAEIRCAVGHCDTTLSGSYSPADSVAQRYMFFEVALSYSQFSGFRSNIPGIDIRGTVREIPGVTLYATYRDDTKKANNKSKFFGKVLSPYLGLRSGLLQLNNVSLYDSVKVDTVSTYSAAGTVFQLGWVAGVELNLGGRVRLSTELSNTRRKFPNVQWTSGGGARLAANYPRELDFSGSGFTAAMQLTLRPFKP